MHQMHIDIYSMSVCNFLHEETLKRIMFYREIPKGKNQICRISKGAYCNVFDKIH